MEGELKLFRLTPSSGKPPAREASAASPRPGRGEEAEEGFASVLQEASSEPAPKTRSEGAPAPRPENGLAAGQETTAGEEGSSRSASLSPEDPDLVEKSEIPLEPQVFLSVQAEPLLPSAGGELPFLVPQLLADGEAPVLDEAVPPAVPAPAPQLPVAAVSEAPVQPNFFVPALADAPAGPPSEAAAKVKEPAPAVPLPPSPIEDAAGAPGPKPQVAASAALEPKLPAPPAEAPKDEKELARRLQPAAASPAQPLKAEEPGLEAPKPQEDGRLEELLRRKAAPVEPAPQKDPKGIQAPAERAPEAARGNRRLDLPGVGSRGEASVPEVEPSSAGKLDARVLEAVYRNGEGRKAVEAAEASPKEPAPPEPADGLLQDLPGLARLREPRSAAPSEPAAPKPMLPGSLEDQVLRQIRVRLQPGLSQVDINLFPPELGSVRIRFELEGERLKARVEAAERSTALLLERHLPELRAAMVQAGIEVKEFEILGGQSAEAFGFARPHPNEDRGRSGAHGDPERAPWHEGEEGAEDSRELVVSRAGGGIDYFI